jgi:hypothetical protein
VLVADGAVLVLQPQADVPVGEWLLQAGTEVSSGASPPAPAVSTRARPTSGARTEVTRTDDGRGGRHHPDPGHPEAHDPDPGRAYSRRSEPGHSGAGRSEPGPCHRDAGAAGAESGPDRGEIPLDRYLLAHGGSPAASCTPVLAVGSNASPAQLQRKLINAGLRALIPITAVSVRGLAAGVSAHVSRPGYLPATPIPSAGAASDLWVLWLDEAALAAVDATEPNYDRVRLLDRCPVRLTTGQPVTECWVYQSRHGYLLNNRGEPRRLTDQPTLISALLAEIPALPSLAGTSPQEWIERTRDAAVRDAIREVFGSAGLVRRGQEL